MLGIERRGVSVTRIDELPVLDDVGPEFAADYVGVMRRKREQCWLARSSIGVTVLTYPEAQELCKDDRFIQPHVPMLHSNGITSGHIFDAVDMAATSKDGSEHLRLRRLISHAFTPRRVERYRELMQSIVEESVDRVADAGRCEFVADIAVGYPMGVICRMLGVPDEDRPKFHGWLDEQMKILEWAGLETRQRSAWDEMYDYLSDLLEQRRSAPGEDLITALLAAEDDGDRLTHDEVIWQINMLLGAGQDTTRCQLALAMATFIDHPAQWQRVADEPDVVASAVDEVLRYVPTLMSLPKIATTDLALHDVEIPAGTPVFISYPAVNRDPSVFTEPDRFDIGRSQAAPMTFGHGVHYCLGAVLARMELREALPILARRMRTPTLDGEIQWRPAAGVTGPNRLPLRFET